MFHLGPIPSKTASALVAALRARSSSRFLAGAAVAAQTASRAIIRVDFTRFLSRSVRESVREIGSPLGYNEIIEIQEQVAASDPVKQVPERMIPRPAAKPAPEHLPALTGIRFFLALWVVLHHISGPGMMLEPFAKSLPAGPRALLRGGYLAVGTFFALSGFVLSRRYSKSVWNRKNLYKYAIGRVARIYPVYALSLLLIAPFILMDFRPAWVANYVLLLQGWFDAIPVYWNTPAWSLSCELFFYCCFPLAIMLCSEASWLGAAALAGTACMLTSVMRSLDFQEAWKPLMHFSDFLIGIAAANMYGLLSRRGSRFRLSGRWLYLPCTAAAVAIIAQPDSWRWTTLNGILRPLNAVILVGLALGGGLLARFLSTDTAVYLGKSSYSLYILHVPLLWWYKFADPVNPLPPFLSGLLYTTIAVGASAFVFRWFEEPANLRVRDALQSRASILRPSAPSS
jgi:peptidoglycan/LPS O-acetylase OafA/YrhL